jgi:hypothetical protein
MLQHSPESLVESTVKYESRLTDAVKDPLGRQNIKNIYFGAIMGFSAMLPTFIHLFLSARSIWMYLHKVSKRRFQRL